MMKAKNNVDAQEKIHRSQTAVSIETTSARPFEHFMAVCISLKTNFSAIFLGATLEDP